MVSPSHALAQCFEFASGASEAALRRALDQAVSLINADQMKATSQPERIALGEASREILSHGTLWCRQYPGELRKASAQALHAKPAQTAAAPSGKAELTLVEDADIVEAIESSRLLQHVLPLVERPVSELDALVSAALGHATVRPELNPLRPEIFAKALRAVIGRTPHTGAWMKYLAQPLGTELQEIYSRLVAKLQQAKVQAVGYGITPAAQAARAARAAAPQARDFEPTQGGEEAPPVYRGHLSGPQISQALLRNFLAHGLGPEVAQALPQAYYAEVERELQALQAQADSGHAPLQDRAAAQAYREMPAVDRPVRSLGVQSSLDGGWGAYAGSRERSLVRTKLRQDATRVGQVLGLELVRKVVNQVAQDPRLLAPVREAIVALEPSLLRLAMVDPRFVSEEAHPGRWLMERVAQRSFKFNDEFSSAFAGFFHQVRDAFNELNALQIQTSQPFQQALARLEGFWNAQDQREADQQQPAVDAVQFAERRQADADQIARALSSRPDLEKVPNVVHEFLFGPWALVIAHARLTNKTQQADPHDYAGIITDLLWSVKREVTLKQPAQLFQRVPHLVGTLRSGLASIGQDPEQSEPFFQALMKLHHPVLKLRRAKTRQDARESGAAPLLPLHDEEEATFVVPEKTEGQPWMSARELDAAGFQETLPTDMADLAEAPSSTPITPRTAATASEEAAAAPSPAAASQVDGASPEMALAQLREGDWVDLCSKRQWLRAQLVWASSKATLFMFVSQGGRPHSMTKRICERLIRERFLRPVRTHAVVAQALQAIAEEPGADGRGTHDGEAAMRQAGPAAPTRAASRNSAFSPIS